MNAWNDSAKTFTCTHSSKIFETMIIGLNRTVVSSRFSEILKVPKNDAKIFTKLGYLCNLYKIEKTYKMLSSWFVCNGLVSQICTYMHMLIII